MKATLRELAELTGGELVGNSADGVSVITGIASLENALGEDIAFFNNPRYVDDLASTQAGAVLVARDFDSDSVSLPLIKVDDPSTAFAAIARAHVKKQRDLIAGVHASAVVADDVELDQTRVCIGPGVIIESDVRISDRTTIRAGSFIGEGSRIGEDCDVRENVTLAQGTILGDRVIIQPGATLGGDGFGYDTKDGRHAKIEQLGFVQLDDDVEVGANSTIDRGRFGRTWIKRGTKIDNLVQIGHNCVIGEDCIIVALTGIAGSSVIGDRVTMAAQVGVAGHLKIGPDSVLGARTGVTKSLPGSENYLGFPVASAREERRRLVGVRKIPEVLRRLEELEAREDKE